MAFLFHIERLHRPKLGLRVIFQEHHLHKAAGSEGECDFLIRPVGLLLLISSFGLFVSMSVAAREHLCPNIVISRNFSPGLNVTEKILVCGDEKTDDAVGKSWRRVPFSQAKFHLKTFLHNRGYFDVDFKEQENALYVTIGEPTKVKKVIVSGVPAFFSIEEKGNIIEQVLTPELLDDLENWVAFQLEVNGYPCPDVKSKANSDGSVAVSVNTGQKQKFAVVIEEPIESLNPGIIRRYDAFQLGNPFDARLLRITEKRAVTDGTVQTLHLNSACGPDGAIVRQEALIGPPRLLRFGFGVDTEGLVQARISWSNSRVGRMASQTRISAYASILEQRFDTSFDWYHLPYSSRRFIRPQLTVSRENEKYFEFISSRAQVVSATSWDGEDWHLAFQSGPLFDVINTLDGIGPRRAQFLSLDTNLSLISHTFEYYQRSPRAGASFSLGATLNTDRLVSSASAQKLRAGGEVLINYSNYDPPLLIFGLRGVAATTVSEERAIPGTLLPPNFRYYLGGSADLRGFGRGELPADGQGGLTSIYGGFETRVIGVLPISMQPFGFIDLGILGETPFLYNFPIYWSPGFGVRWESPVGSFRGTLAHGLVAGSTDRSTREQISHWQLYLSFGEEF